MPAEVTLETIRSSRHAKSGKSRLFCLVSCIILTTLLTGLVGLRLYSLSLEYRLARLQQEILTKEDTCTRLEKELAGLMSPSRVFAKAMNDLGMGNAPKVVVVRVNTGNEPVLTAQGAKGTRIALSENQEREGSIIAGILNLFTRKASARQ